MADWHIGQQVVCVKDFVGFNPYKDTLPEKGSVYTIRGFHTSPLGVGIYLEEIINPRHNWTDGFVEAAFSVEGFRPVRKTDISVFTEMLNVTPVRETQDA